MYCIKCGNQVGENDNFCGTCGTDLRPQRALASSTPINNYSQPTYPQYFQYAQYPPIISQKNGMAVAGFVCSFFVPILGWVFGGIGLSRSKKRSGKGKGLSIAAIAVSSAMFFFNLLSYL